MPVGFVYARTSEEDDPSNPRLSIPFQIARGTEFWERRGVDEVRVFSDPDRKSHNLNRPAVQALLAEMTAGHGCGVWTYNLDRFTRNVWDMPALWGASDAGKCPIFEDGQEWDWENPEGEVGLLFRATFAQYYRRRTSKNVKAVLNRKMDRGEWPGGRIPYGWQLVEGAGLIVDIDAAAVVIRVFRAYGLDGRSTTSIAESLNADGIPSPRSGDCWRGNGVIRVLQAPQHRGLFRWGGRFGPWPYARIVPDDLAALAWDRLQSRTFRRGPNTLRHEWQGLVQCGKCEAGTTYVRLGQDRGENPMYYRCSAGKHSGRRIGGAVCGVPSVRGTTMDHVTQVLRRIIEVTQPTPRIWTPPEEVAERVWALEEERARESVIYRNRGSSTTEYEAALRRIDAAIAALTPPPAPVSVEAVKSLGARWPSLSVGERNGALRLLVEKAVIGGPYVVLHLNDVGWDEWPHQVDVARRGTRVVVHTAPIGG